MIRPNRSGVRFILLDKRGASGLLLKPHGLNCLRAEMAFHDPNDSEFLLFETFYTPDPKGKG